MNAECLANPKNTTFPRVLACTRGDFRFMKKSCFLVVLSAFGRFLAFWASPLKYHGHLGYSFGLQAWEGNKRPHRIGVTRGHVMRVFVIYCVSSTQKKSIRWPRISPVRGGLLFSSQACTPKVSPGISAGSPKNAQYRPKALKTTKKIRFFI